MRRVIAGCSPVLQPRGRHPHGHPLKMWGGWWSVRILLTSLVCERERERESEGEGETAREREGATEKGREGVGARFRHRRYQAQLLSTRRVQAQLLPSPHSPGRDPNASSASPLQSREDLNVQARELIHRLVLYLCGGMMCG